MKRVMKCIACLLAIVVLAVAVFIMVKLNKKFPDEIVFGEEMQTFSDNGMYFIKNNRVCFIDNATGKDVVVCNRANCEHNDKTCNAYISGLIVDMMVYDKYIYISCFDYETIFGEDGEFTEEGITKLIRLGIDGAHRKDIYSADSGAVLSMMAMGDTIYFTAYTRHGEFEVNVYDHDTAIYAYNIRWDKLERVKDYAHTEGRTSEAVYIIGNLDKETLYIWHGYVEGVNDGTNPSVYIYEKVNIDTGETIELRTFRFKAVEKLFNVVIDKEKKYLREETWSPVDILTMSECDDNFIEIKELFTAENARVDWLGGYMHIVASDYLKALYDYEEDRWYIAKTSFTQEGTYISDIKKVDRDKNVVYIDATDYTGYKPGDALPGDISNKAVRDWSIFLEENFIPYEDLTEEQLKSLTWIDIK
ncbi:MAG: hypothetical protein K2G45_10365 [Lachnospiraceae bacterium]|nr:hypothetical protein [Lachnospiraceae bacterium]